MKTSVTAGLGLVLSLLLGCSSDRMAPVSGKVTYKGKSVTQGPYQGKITFVDPDNPGRVGVANISADGTYKVRAPIGACKVAIESAELEPPPDPKKRTQVRPGMFIGKSLIPEKYMSYAQSGLTFQVQKGENTKDFDLKD